MSKNNNKKRPPNNNQPKVLIPPTDETTEVLIKETEIEKNEDKTVIEKEPEITVPQSEEIQEEVQTVETTTDDKAEENIVKEEPAKIIDEVETLPNSTTIVKEKNIVEKEVQKKSSVASYTVYASKNGSPLQNAKIVARLKSLNISYEVIDNDIKLKSCNTLDDAIAYRKFIAGKGLKPIIV